MFPYFGSKKSLASQYPSPRYPLVVEPFAGSMSYSMHWKPERAIGYEIDGRVVELWARMLTISGDEVRPEIGSSTNDLLVKLMSYSEHALTSGPMTVTSRMVRDWESLHRRWASQTSWVSDHCEVISGNWWDAENVEATWFIDPPYEKANRRGYKFGASSVDYNQLAEWCRTRRGQVIVCEQEEAEWLPFVPFSSVSTHRGSKSREVVWMNDTLIT